MPPKSKKRASNSVNSAPKRTRGDTASQAIAIDSQSSAPTPPPLYTHTFESRLRESQPEDAIVAPADDSSEQATITPSSDAAEAPSDEAFDSHLADNYDGLD
ncbi:hypothetical protein BDW02DRAFT_594172 [Decorospora gaudefroyi]|uniref:Uncharacterized protein n=1 Tax=Decorospora gaudefroyi TaxID=184978 RepID=A0A6A5KVT6_9PLEO|nr:hypothetical protein BDW02DRAFT_594172 [Decorospora gaudefroyi]